MAFLIDLEHNAPDVVTLAQARKQLQLEDDFTEDDALISTYIEAAISEAERIINSEITEKKFKIQGKSFADVLKFNRQKITAVDNFQYKDSEGNLQTIAADNYAIQNVDKFENKIEFNENYELPKVKEFTPDAVQLSVTVGYPANKVPKAIIKNLLLMITDYYEKRMDSVKEKCTAAEVGLQKFRRY